MSCNGSFGKGPATSGSHESFSATNLFACKATMQRMSVGLMTGNSTIAGDFDILGDLSLRGRFIRQESDTPIIYVNAGTGSDSNDGLTPESAMFSIQAAIDQVGTYFAATGIVQLQGSDIFDLGPDPVLNISPNGSSAGRLIIRGTESDAMQDSVASITAPATSNIGPFQTWKQIVGTTGGYLPSDYRTAFIRNDTLGRYYVVLDNGTSSVDTITGDGAPSGLVNPWSIGDEYTLYKTESILQFSGQLTLNNPNNVDAVFETLWIQPATGAIWKNPMLQTTTFRGCRMDANSDRSYTGSFKVEGCYSENTATINILFCARELERIVQLDSCWLNGPGLRVGDGCSAFFILSTACLEETEFLGVAAGSFQGYSIMATECTSHRMVHLNNGANCQMTYLDLASRTNITFPADCIFVEGAVGIFENTKLQQLTNLTIDNNCLYNEFGTQTLLLGTVDFVSNTGHCISNAGNAELSLLASSVALASSTTNVSMIELNLQSHLVVRLNSGSMSHTFTQNASSSRGMISISNGASFSIFNEGNANISDVTIAGNNKTIFEILAGGQVVLGDDNPSSPTLTITNSFNTGGIVTAEMGSSYIDNISAPSKTYTTSGTSTTISLRSGSSAVFNQALTDTNTDVTGPLLVCGSVTIPKTTTSTSINDYSAAPTENCSASFR